MGKADRVRRRLNNVRCHHTRRTSSPPIQKPGRKAKQTFTQILETNTDTEGDAKLIIAEVELRGVCGWYWFTHGMSWKCAFYSPFLFLSKHPSYFISLFPLLSFPPLRITWCIQLSVQLFCISRLKFHFLLFIHALLSFFFFFSKHQRKWSVLPFMKLLMKSENT